MSSYRKDVVDGTDVANWKKPGGLMYTCNAGWLDLAHLNPYDTRPEIGAANLWRQMLQERHLAPAPFCLPTPWYGPGPLDAAPLPVIHEECDSKPLYRFPDGKSGHLVRFRQDSPKILGSPGEEGLYVVKCGLTTEDKKRVALAIFVEVALQFESLQRFAEQWLLIGKSGFSQEDLVSDLIGFYVGIGEVSLMDAIRACHPISKAGALAIWDREGAVGTNKNLTFNPKFAGRTANAVGVPKDECMGQPKRFPKMFTRIHPAPRGYLFDEFPTF